MESNDSDVVILLSSVYKVVPWMNWDEWNYVRKSIFSSSPKLISAALQKISAWESRGCLPIAVELTAVIVEIHQKDPFFRSDSSTGDALASEKMLNMLYCMFILRLVNDFVEPAHKKTGRSISDLAEAVGIPRTLVDIRHESTHRFLPSLKLVRSASLKALEWLKANYWEPQRNAVRDRRKEVKYRLREMILCLRAHQLSKVSPAKSKRKHSKMTAVLVKCHKLSHISERLLASKSDGSKAQICKFTRRVAHLYSLYTSEVVSVLLELLLSQASDVSDDMDSDQHSDDSDCSIPNPTSISPTDVKMVITKVSRKKPRLLLSLLKATFEMIEKKDNRNFENGGNESSQNQIEIDQVRRLHSLVLYLVKNLKAMKESGRIMLFEENQTVSTDEVATPKVILTGLLRKCLSSFAPGDKHLARSALLLAEMSGNRLLVQKLKKLHLLPFLDPSQLRSDDIDCSESLLLEEEDSVKKAAERLERIKLRLAADREKRIRRHSSSNSGGTTGRWTVAKAWVSCPIGMVPCSFSSTAVIPVLDVIERATEFDKPETSCQIVKDVCDDELQTMVSDDAEPSGDDGGVKKFNQKPEDEVSPEPESPSLMEGRLLIGGLWKKVSEEELASIESDIRIFA